MLYIFVDIHPTFGFLEKFAISRVFPLPWDFWTFTETGANYLDATELLYGHDKILHVFIESFFRLLHHTTMLRYTIIQTSSIYVNVHFSSK